MVVVVVVEIGVVGLKAVVVSWMVGAVEEDKKESVEDSEDTLEDAVIVVIVGVEGANVAMEQVFILEINKQKKKKKAALSVSQVHALKCRFGNGYRFLFFFIIKFKSTFFGCANNCDGRLLFSALFSVSPVLSQSCSLLRPVLSPVLRVHEYTRQ